MRHRYGITLAAGTALQGTLTRLDELREPFGHGRHPPFDQFDASPV
jgi:hypothetical protein